MHISLTAEKIIDIFGFSITNTLLTSWLVIGVLVLLAYFVGKEINTVPRGAQNVAEVVIESLMSFFTTIAGSREKAEKYFPIVTTIFIFVIASNWAGVFPGVGSIGIYEEHIKESHIQSAYNDIEHVGESIISMTDNEEVSGVDENEGIATTESVSEHEDMGSEIPNAAVEANKEAGAHSEKVFVPLFRTVNSDLNVTLALALIAVTLSHYFGIAALGGLKHAGKFFNFKNPITFFVGILEFISEFAKIISFSFRLFGNIFAGEVLLVIITFLVPVLVPLPFYGLELFVGFIQALIFAVLTMMFLVVATEHH